MVRGCFLVILGSILFLVFSGYFTQVQRTPKVGGEYIEAILGQPRFINPVLASTNDADRDLVQLIYSSLFKYDNQGNLIPDLIENYNIEENGLSYNITLKKDVLWHDGESLTANDVIFTIKTIQDPEYKSPLISNWQGVRVEKIDNYTISFKLNNIYAPFLHNLTIAVLPQHLWAGISAQNFALAQYNLKPIGSGPYKFQELKKDENGKVRSIELVRNEDFYLPAPSWIYSDINISEDTIQGPFIKNIILKFYSSQASLIEACQKRQVHGASFVSAANESELRGGFNVHQISLPVYYAVFFNQTESKLLADETVRSALTYATDRQEIINKVLNGRGVEVDSPLLNGWLGHSAEIGGYGFDLEKAISILEEAEWKDEDEDGIREKKLSSSDEETTRLEITLLTTDWPELEQTAQVLQEQWNKIGVQVNLEIVDATAMQQEYIRPRQYQALLFGEVLSADPDPFAFWHSSQKKDPGLNLALYQNKDVDKLLESARQTMDQEERMQKYAEFQKLLVEDMPAIFLYSPIYLYPVTGKIKGFSIERLPQYSQRFSQVEGWYMKTKWVWK